MRTVEPHDRIADITAAAVRDLAHTQPWSEQFRRRALEFRALRRLHDLAGARRVLEIGCGNAFASALLSAGRELVVATDLPSADPATHSIGLGKARALLDGLRVERYGIAAASGERLPFREGAFDLVISLFVLEHVPDREAAVAEMHRVLDRGGLAVHAVPGRLWALDAPLRLSLYLGARLIAHLGGGRGPRWSEPGGAPTVGAPAAGAGLWRRFRAHYPRFPLPPPHGAYRSYLEEVGAYSRGRWRRLFERHGFEVLACRPIMVLPLCLMHMLLGEAGFRLYERLFGVDQWLADRRALAPLGRFLGVVARKAE
ncbi:MAG: class I SAM-dependent methyltransferase [Candidatus Rokubacteria bacterium]|nr:class I SAM-dependent methyltransferase [Candidatus Rokubacteria bacterium]